MNSGHKLLEFKALEYSEENKNAPVDYNWSTPSTVVSQMYARDSHR